MRPLVLALLLALGAAEVASAQSSAEPPVLAVVVDGSGLESGRLLAELSRATGCIAVRVTDPRAASATLTLVVARAGATQWLVRLDTDGQRRERRTRVGRRAVAQQLAAESAALLEELRAVHEPTRAPEAPEAPEVVTTPSETIPPWPEFERPARGTYAVRTADDFEWRIAEELIDPFRDLPRPEPVAYSHEVLDPFMGPRARGISDVLDPWVH